MKQAEVRFYAELNDFLPPGRRGRARPYTFEVSGCDGQGSAQAGVPVPPWCGRFLPRALALFREVQKARVPGLVWKSLLPRFQRVPSSESQIGRKIFMRVCSNSRT